MSEPTVAFIAFCRNIGVCNMTLVNPHILGSDVLAAAKTELQKGGVRVMTLNHLFACYPNIEQDTGEAALRMNEAIEAAAALGAPQVYILTGGRGSLDWEQAALRLAEMIAPCRLLAELRGIRLLVENANSLNADIHMAFTLDDTVRLAEIMQIGVCVDLGSAWFEGNLADKFARAMPLTHLVQLSDYILGDRFTPHRAVPGDGVIPLERLIGQLLDLGYQGVFDVELVGPRIESEGHRVAFERSAQNTSDILARLRA